MQENRNLALGIHGPGCYRLDIEGKEWTFHQLTQALKAELEEWAKHQARATIRSQRPYLDRDEYNALLASKVNEIERGEYRWMRDGFRRSVMGTPEGNKRLYAVSLSVAHGPVPQEDLDGLYDWLESDEERQALSMEIVKAILYSPPSPSPATTPGATTMPTNTTRTAM